MESGGFLAGLRRFVLWDYARATWQYDVMVGLILAFIFLTPRDFFRDQPRPRNMVLVHAERGASVFWGEPDLVAGTDAESRRASVERLIRSQPGGKNRTVLRVEPNFDEEMEIRGYMVYTTP